MLDETVPVANDRQGETPPLTTSGTSLFFDFDGTLVDLAPTPDAVVVETSLIAALERLAFAMPGRVAIVSGRSLDVLDGLLGPFSRTIAMAGSHGAERRDANGTLWAADRPEGLDHATDALRYYADSHDLLYEAKSLGAALHFRHRPQAEAAALEATRVVAADHGLTVQKGKMMVELRCAGDKGDAVTALLATPTMAGTRPLFFGDDVTDEDGFVAAARAGGAGVLVGDPRATAARYNLPDVNAVRDWIDKAVPA